MKKVGVLVRCVNDVSAERRARGTSKLARETVAVITTRLEPYALVSVVSLFSPSLPVAVPYDGARFRLSRGFEFPQVFLRHTNIYKSKNKKANF